MKIAIGGDHGGFELKDKLITFLKSQNHEVIDMGAYEFNSTDLTYNADLIYTTWIILPSP